MTQKVTFTIIIPVIHSLEDISRCLESLKKLDYPKDLWQIAIVDCRVVPGLTPFLAKVLPKQNYKVKILQVSDHPLYGPKWLVEQRTNEACNYAIKMMPAQVYIFTEDDCTFMPDWLNKFKDALTDEVGALGGPDILPDGLGWFPKALDCTLNSFFGTAGIRGKSNQDSEYYYPRRQNMAIPERVINRVGGFSEEVLTGSELDLTHRIRTAGFKIKFLADNPVIHRRVTTYITFFRSNAYRAASNVQSLRRQKAFASSLHFFVFLLTVATVLLGLLSLFNIYLRILLMISVATYFIVLCIYGIVSAIRTSSVCVGFGSMWLMFTHHFSLVIGTLFGALKRINSNEYKAYGNIYQKFI